MHGLKRSDMKSNMLHALLDEVIVDFGILELVPLDTSFVRGYSIPRMQAPSASVSRVAVQQDRKVLSAAVPALERTLP